MDVYSLLARVRTQKPLVHHLTNLVTMYDCAQVVKVMGGSPVMAHAPEEVEDMVSLASVLVLNIGTLSVGFIESMKKAALKANTKGIPVVLDVCGAGATPLRDKKCSELLNETRITIIKGNASEVARIAGEAVRTKGVDAAYVNKNLVEIALKVALKREATVVITGKEDIVADKDKQFIVQNGDEMMAQVVGTGCMAASVIGTFAAVEKDVAYAAACALCCFEIAAELAREVSGGPGTFKEKLYDYLYSLNRETIEKRQKIKDTGVLLYNR